MKFTITTDDGEILVYESLQPDDEVKEALLAGVEPNDLGYQAVRNYLHDEVNSAFHVMKARVVAERTEANLQAVKK